MSDDLIERLRDAHANATQRIFGSNIFDDAAQALSEARAEIERLRQELNDSKERHSRLFDNYQAALTAGATSPPTREGIAAAVCETNYKYFGDYELSESQWGAVHCLVNAAHHYLTLQEMLSDMEALKNTYRDDCLLAESELSTLRARVREVVGRIIAIENKEYGGDYDEIDEAREIARQLMEEVK